MVGNWNRRLTAPRRRRRLLTLPPSLHLLGSSVASLFCIFCVAEFELVLRLLLLAVVVDALVLRRFRFRAFFQGKINRN